MFWRVFFLMTAGMAALLYGRAKNRRIEITLVAKE
jgi:flagellar motor protein MotB